MIQFIKLFININMNTMSVIKYISTDNFDYELVGLIFHNGDKETNCFYNKYNNKFKFKNLYF